MDGRVKEDGSVSGIERLLLAIEEGRTLGGIRNVEATEILRRSKETDFGASGERLNLISDLAPRNFVKDNDGKLYCIDPMIRAN